MSPAWVSFTHCGAVTPATSVSEVVAARVVIPPLEIHAAARGNEYCRISRTGGAIIADHHASLGGVVRVALRIHLGNDRRGIAADWLAGKIELVGSLVDIGARAGKRPGGAVKTGPAGQSRRADIAIRPAAWQG